MQEKESIIVNALNVDPPLFQPVILPEQDNRQKSK